MGIIFYFSSSTRPQALQETPDYVLHSMEYFGLGFLAARCFRFTFQGSRAALLFLASVLFCTLYGVSDEFHQSFVPERASSVADMVFDMIGSTAGVAAMFLVHTRLENRDRYSSYLSRKPR
jgi:VanZ family protein